MALNQLATDGNYFVVRDAKVHYMRGATLRDELDIVSSPYKIGQARWCTNKKCATPRPRHCLCQSTHHHRLCQRCVQTRRDSRRNQSSADSSSRRLCLIIATPNGHGTAKYKRKSKLRCTVCSVMITKPTLCNRKSRQDPLTDSHHLTNIVELTVAQHHPGTQYSRAQHGVTTQSFKQENIESASGMEKKLARTINLKPSNFDSAHHHHEHPILTH